MFSLSLATLALLQGTSLDTAGIYTVVLRDLRADYPNLPVVLAETRSGVACMPHCGAQLREPGQRARPEQPGASPELHSAAIVQQLRERGLVQATCAVEEGSFGCAGHPGHLFVGLGTVQDAPSSGPPPVEGAFWVKAAVLVPCSDRTGAACRVPEGMGWWFLVAPAANGEWNVVRRLPAFSI